MNTITWRRLALIGGAVVIAAFTVFYFTYLKARSGTGITISPAFAEYVSSYTTGTIPSGSAIRIAFTRDVVDSALVGQPAPGKLFSFQPTVNGKAFWLDQRTIEFRPDERFLSGTAYEIAFELATLFENLPRDLRELVYSIHIMPQHFEVMVDNIKPYVKTELKRQRVEGTVSTADFADAAALEKAFSASQDGKALRVSWAHGGEGRQHQFVVEDVARTEAAGKVKIKIDGSPINTTQTEERDIDIPALGDFKVVNVRVDQGSSQHVVVQFSDPLNEKQNLAGLISISGLADLDYDVSENEVRVYPPVRQTGTKVLIVEQGIRNILDYRLAQGNEFELLFEQLKPGVRFTSRGNILPSTDGLLLPFEAVNLKSVDIEIIKIYEKNVIQFLQVNQLDGNYEMRRVAKPLVRQTISLENAGVSDLGKWNRFTLDLANYMTTEPGAIYQVKISFRRAYSAYACEGSANEAELSGEESDWDEGEEESYWDGYEDYYYTPGYQWEERDNPCHVSYYTSNRAIRKNVLASDLGLIVKRGGDGQTHVFVTDLKTTQPLSGVQVDLFDFQQQKLASASTGSNGQAVLASREKPFLVMATQGSQRGYVKMDDGESLSLSNFDVGGASVRQGLKGFLYGERGVWRPGDSLFLTFILEDKKKLLPASHPVVFELQNPQGQVATRLVRSSSTNGFYSFATATEPDAPTGNWLARVKVGGTEFTQTVKIETIKPNRLKINLDFGVDKLTSEENSINGRLKVNWLHGAPGKNLKAQFEAVLADAETTFAGYEGYSFEDPLATEFTSETYSILDDVTDDNGEVAVNATLETEGKPAGMLNAVIRGKVFEESGNFSIDRFNIPYYPYSAFTGIRLPQGDKARGMLLTDTTHQVEIVTVDANGRPVSHDGIEMKIYKLQWSWWWDNSGQTNYMEEGYTEPVAQGTTRTSNGKGTWKFKIKYPEWGRFLVQAYDPVSGHSTGKIVYIDWPGWAGRARKEASGSTMLSFSADKSFYNVGEKARVVIPGSGQGRALVSIENGSGVLQSAWLETQAGDNNYTFDVTPDMAPNVFVNVSLLQPHAQTTNDLPMRLYGVIPVQVEDAQTRLEPVLSMPDELEPGERVTVKVSEKSRRPMTYTLAVVDEGLLDITRFKTPDAWTNFYAREALGVKTWDIYDDVLGALGGRLERLLAMGGSDEMKAQADEPKANRFKPVVVFFGPFTLSGGSQEHSFVMPQYVGSVKTMLVAGFEGAYGKTEKATPVRKPLMVLATLPRVLGPEEKVKLPITLFAQDKSIREVKIDVKVSGPVELPSGSTRTVSLNGASDLTTDFDLLVKSQTGIGRVEVTATSGKNKSITQIDIEVRNPNPPVSSVLDGVVEAGQSWSQSIPLPGLPGTNSAMLEVSSLPPLNLSGRMRYLLQYPYGCVEQTTSSVFPQLFLANIKSLSPEEKSMVQRNVRAGIDRLKSFAHPSGGFAYWPGEQEADSWSSTYAGHFLVEADRQGYLVSADLLKKWKKFQRRKSAEWRKHSEYSSSELIQAYRLYTLALAGDADLTSMNRLREAPALPSVASWMLAAAYATAGQEAAAKDIIARLSLTVKSYQEMAYSYGSDVRDKAIILETLVKLNDRTRAFEIVKELSATLSNENYWMSTQAVAWAFNSIAAFAGQEQRGELRFAYGFDGKETSATTELSVAQVTLPIESAKNRQLKLTNAGKGPLFVRVMSQGVPARGQEEDAEKNLSLTVNYTTTDGRELDPSRLEPGSEFVAEVTVVNPGVRGNYKNMALAQMVPAGWEVNNLRFEEAENRLSGDVPTYQDVRDDRVFTYFDLKANERKTFRVLLTASYSGEFYLPAITCEAMYDGSVYARKKGQMVVVAKKEAQ
ncbi:MAG: alpha-2-macroglobulin family protein [Cyclobacteriaceae bacterium]|jgi:uncharacterized protein YfaS (alpha-2-macroglobulin family)